MFQAEGGYSFFLCKHKVRSEGYHCLKVLFLHFLEYLIDIIPRTDVKNIIR